jgi:hypothetical protein
MQKSGNKDKAAEATALMQKMQEQSKARNFEEAEKTADSILKMMGVSAQFRSGSRQAPSIRSLAVLPLENLSGDASQDYFSDGMTDELITELGQIGELRAISRSSAMTYKGVHKPLPQIAQELHVDAVLRSQNLVRITAAIDPGFRRQASYGPRVMRASSATSWPARRRWLAPLPSRSGSN